jgi:hypothetical protein
MNRLLAFLFLFGGAISSPAAAGDLTTIECGEPKGVRWIKLGEQAQSFPDGFTGVHPTFIFDPSSPTTLHVLFGASKLIGDIIPKKATKASILVISAQHVLAAEFAGEEFWVYSVYPENGIAYYTKHGSHPLAGPYAAAFSSDCSISGKPLP